jgi:hypothetical protein
LCLLKLGISHFDIKFTVALLHRKTVKTFDIICTLNVTEKLKCKKIEEFEIEKKNLVIKSDNTNWETVEVQIN